ncbi:MAG: response regulator [Eubacteriales bacterium]|nr:response regulator [Eubacteriales bacterium]
MAVLAAQAEYRNGRFNVKIVFVVDDNQTNLKSASDALENTYNVYTISSGMRMFKLAKKIMPDLILLDVEMPEMDGFETMERLKADGRLGQVPVIFLTARQDALTEMRGLELGALDFINKPFSPPILLKRIETHLGTDKLIKETKASLRDIQNAMISVLADMVENRDKDTGGHIERTQRYLDILVREMIRCGTYSDELEQWDINTLLPSAQLHDIGKIAISDLILNKPTKLTDEEFELIKTTPQLARKSSAA